MTRAYDAALAAAQFPGPVHTLMASDVIGRRQVMSRLRQLQKELTLQQNFLANCRGRVRRLLRISPSSAGVGR